MGSSCRVDVSMKVLVALSLIVLAAAKPQILQQPSWVIPTIKSAETAEDTPIISTYTASYPHAGFPWVQAALPSTYRFPYATPYTYSPFVTTIVKPTLTTPEEATRQKRSAEPEAEPEADPAVVYTTGIHTAGSAINYPTVATIPATVPATIPTTAVRTYTLPQNLRYTQIPYTGFSPIAGVSPYSTISPYTTFPWFNPIVTPAKEAKAEEGAGVTRAKRSAEPEADPQVLTTGVTGFTYPAINTRTSPSTYTYQNFPTTYSIPSTFSTSFPITYSAGIPMQYGNIPTTTGVIYG